MMTHLVVRMQAKTTHKMTSTQAGAFFTSPQYKHTNIHIHQIKKKKNIKHPSVEFYLFPTHTQK